MLVYTPSVIDAGLSPGVAVGLTYLHLCGSAPWDDDGSHASSTSSLWDPLIRFYATYNGQAPRPPSGHLCRSAPPYARLLYSRGPSSRFRYAKPKRCAAFYVVTGVGRTGSEVAGLAPQSPTHPVLTMSNFLIVKAQYLYTTQVARGGASEAQAACLYIVSDLLAWTLHVQLASWRRMIRRHARHHTLLSQDDLWARSRCESL